MSRVRRNKSIAPTLMIVVAMLAGAAAIWGAVVWLALRIWH